MCKLHTFVFVFIALDNSRVHMCLYVVVAQIMLLLFNQTEWILMYYQGSLLSYGMCVCLLRKVCLLCFFFFFFAARCVDLRPQRYPLPRFCESGIVCECVRARVCACGRFVCELV